MAFLIEENRCTSPTSSAHVNAVIGPTAAGKTQLLYLLAGLLKPAAGVVEYDGRNIADYDPETFTRFERDVLKQLAPFYSFGSRMGSHTAGELATNPGGLTAQLIKAEDRAHAQDPSVPDHVLAGTALPLGELDDGTKRFLTGAGLMHEPSVNTLGSAIAGLAHKDSLRHAGYDVLSMANPLIKVPGEYVTGQSFFKRGQMQDELTPNVGQMMADIGTRTGLRESDAGPVKFPGSNALEMALQVSPFARLASTGRSLTDTRKGIPEKVINTLTGARLTDVSPKSQQYTLINRAQKLAKESGAKAREDVYFSKSDLEALDKSNPKLAARQRELQLLLKQIRPKAKKRPSTKGK